MKKIIIVAPHFLPSNLTAVHRARLFVKHLPSFGWEPIILTVHHRYYEETLDWNLAAILPSDIRIEKVGAIPVKPIRIIGDIGIRGFIPMLLRIISLSKKEKIDFLYITIPSFYASLLGPIVYYFTGIKYGIDYIDPWIHDWPGGKKPYSRAWLSSKLSKLLEPVAVKKASLITGVAPGYYQDTIKRNPRLSKTCLTQALPFGGEKEDFLALSQLGLLPGLFHKKDNVIDLVYAGAMLPNAFKPLEAIFYAISQRRELYRDTRFHFIGTGKTPDTKNGFAVKPLAKEYGLWQDIIFEYPKRIAYLDVLTHLKFADGILILGSTESHYTPSKVFQAMLAEKPILAVLHKESTACGMIESSKRGVVLGFSGENDLSEIRKSFNEVFKQFLAFKDSFNSKALNQSDLEQYSAHNMTRLLVEKLNEVIR